MLARWHNELQHLNAKCGKDLNRSQKTNQSNLRYLYTVGLLSPHTLANLLTFICFAMNAG